MIYYGIKDRKTGQYLTHGHRWGDNPKLWSMEHNALYSLLRILRNPNWNRDATMVRFSILEVE
jgi:hypothetical protein